MYRFRSTVLPLLTGAMLVLAAPVQAQPTPGFRGMDVLMTNEDPDGEAIDDMSQVDCYRYPLAYDYDGWIELENIMPADQWSFQPGDPVEVVEYDGAYPRMALLRIDMKRYTEVQITVEYASDPVGWFTNLGDSRTNNGCCGDAATSTFDADVWVAQPPAPPHDPPEFEYDVGVCTNMFDDGRHDLDGLLADAEPTVLTFVVRDQYLHISSDATPLAVEFTGPGIFRIDEGLWDDEANGCNDGVIWLGLNRVVDGTYRCGEGTLRAQITLIGKGPPPQVMPHFEIGAVLPIDLD